ncbi:MAG TPA: hypothetical protein VF320_06740 [Acidimicrobiales bacterium]
MRRPAAVGGPDRRSAGRLPLLTGIALLTVVGAAACGAPGAPTTQGPPGALARIRQSVARTEAAGTAHLVLDSDTSSSTGPGPAQHITAVGDIRFAGPDLSLTTTIRSVPSPAGSSPVPTRASTTLSVHIGRHLYLGSPPPGSTWTETTTHAPYPYLGAVTTQVLEHTDGPVTVVGHRLVDGSTTTEYLVPVPASVQTIRESDAHNRPFDGHVRSAPFALSVWLDRAGRIVRTSGVVVASTSQRPGTVRDVATTTLSAFGEPVHIVAPTGIVHN